MGLLSNVVAKIRERNNRVGDIEDEHRAQVRAAKKLMSSDERELEGYLEEERKKNIKKQLQFYRKKKEQELNKNIILDKKNIFNGQKEIFKDERRIFLNG